jgi:NAD(P)-dependent dehydrogenase (short-subunit alcohol dehydrogenase family)
MTIHAGRLEGKVALVTGGGAGIGEAICLRMAEAGAVVGVLGRTEASVQDVALRIRQNGGEAIAIVADVAVEDEVKAAVNRMIEEFGRIDVLVNNAAIPGTQKPTHEAESWEFDEVFNVNVKGVFLCTKYALIPMLAAGSGNVIHISSINGIIGNADLPLYHATKGATRLMAKTDAVVYAKRGIRVNSVHPGSIKTPLAERASETHPDGPDAYFKMLADMHPVGRQGEPDDVAYGVIYLASDESKFVTGSELVIDGGFTAQ